MSGSHNKLRAACLSAAQQIKTECTAALQEYSDSDSPAEAPSIAECDEPLVQLLGRQASQLLVLEAEESPDAARVDLLFRRLGDLLSIAYSRFYAYLFKELPVCWRQLYTDAAILKFAVLFLLPDSKRSSPEGPIADAALDDMVKTLDLALILAGAAGESRGRRWIDSAFALLEECCSPQATTSPTDTSPPAKKPKLSQPSPSTNQPSTSSWENTPSFSTYEPFTPPIHHPVRRSPHLSLSSFQTYLSSSPPSGPLPIIIPSLLNDWPALTTHPWNKPAYLLSRTFSGRRLVPIELGRSYVSSNWTQRLIPFSEFLSTYIDPPFSPPFPPPSPPTASPSHLPSTPSLATIPTETPSPPTQTGYLAQHPLFSQLPSLLSDILLPDLVYTTPPLHLTDPSLNQPELSEPQLNAWFGPPGTITPLHTDPYHNLLAQVVGRKYIRLYSPRESQRLRPRGKEGGVEMGNTSLWDVGGEEGWDEKEEEAGREEDGEGMADGEGGGNGEREEFKSIPYLECILEPGDTLYIPIGWWHYVRGLSVSFSVSFWWN